MHYKDTTFIQYRKVKEAKQKLISVNGGGGYIEHL